MVTGLDDAGRQGIDGVYYNPNGHPPYIISEAKYNKAKLGKTADGRQMSKEWIDNRLLKAVGEENYNKIRLASLQGDLQSNLFNIKSDGNIIINQLDDMAKKIKWGIFFSKKAFFRKEFQRIYIFTVDFTNG